MARYRGKHAAAKSVEGAGGGGGLRATGTLRRGVTSAAVVAVALAALTASQAPGADVDVRRGAERGPASGDGPPGDGSYHTELPPLDSPEPQPGSGDRDPSAGLPGAGKAEAGVPATLLAAYKKAAAALERESPGCGLRWELLAAIGKVESGQARGGAVDGEGTTLRPILGPVLNGAGFARITDTDGGVWDGDTTFDRAVGPMQFIPSTWARWGADGNADGRRDPGNIHDAALAAGRYLCAGGRDLSSRAGLDQAILSYNNSRAYLRTVLAWYEFYREGTHEVPDGRGPLPTSPGAGIEERAGSDSGSGSGSGSGGSDGSGPGGSDGGKGSDKDGGKDGGDHTDGDGSGDGTGTGDNTGGAGSDDGQSGGTDGGTGDGTDGGSSSPDPAPDAPDPAAPTSLRPVGERELTATTGETFPEPARVRAETAKGKPAPDADVRYEIVGETGARFPWGAKKVTVATDDDGTATAPELRAGDEPGTFTLRATVVEGKTAEPAEDAPATEFRATVEEAPEQRADTLARAEDEPLTAEPDDAFAERLRFTATQDGEPVAEAPVSARLIADKADAETHDEGGDGPQAEENDKGPHFTDWLGRPVRTLTELRTDADGGLTLPRIHTDGHEGTFTLLLATADGARLTVDLTVRNP
ncbi:lytic transglycosylase domain-containing protein [Streptomyces sp. HNM0574]|uniref:lytic transglycosylase domain-containing protein n=1 Tax=Streptomyces sp. HNM0574 TaxID=2714954 RepID=UPI00146C7678|nr:lytic transglycosylase domain-containing protein [Streptomyces sp. HNM0574]NLU67544.1 lytic transglycosylase domain-containing protein [Streptomyces sp. HNM0574]